MQTSSLILGGGCFWCLEAVFSKLKGVNVVTSGYSGGEVENPDYQRVCSGTSGHAEVIKIDYDPAKIQLEDLLAVFFATHDPTTLNRQGNDVGSQYRSVIFYNNESEKQRITKVMENAQSAWQAPIVTQLVPVTDFYTAEKVHQDYYQQNQAQPYCQLVIAPKLEKLKREFSSSCK